MEMGSDGSLCRITSSAAEHNNAVIVVSESELEETKGAPYKIVIIGTIQNPYESSSEAESDEEIDEKVPKKIEPSIGNGEKANTSSDKKTAVNEFRGKGSSNANRSYNRYSSNNFKNRRPNKPYRNHHNSSSKRNSYSQNNSSIIYSNNSPADIEPWVINPNSVMMPNYSYPAYQFPLAPAIDTHLNRLNCESSAKSFGLLGDGPSSYSHFPSQFSQNASKQNYWNDKNDIPNYWNDGHSDNYQRPVPTDRPVSKPKNFRHGKRYQQNVYNNRPWRRGNAPRWNKSKDPKDQNIGHYS